MLVGAEARREGNDVVVKRHVDFSGAWERNYHLKKEIGNGFSEKREMRHILAIPEELAAIDPLVDAALKGDKVCQRLAVARWPQIKVCDGNI